MDDLDSKIDSPKHGQTDISCFFHSEIFCDVVNGQGSRTLISWLKSLKIAPNNSLKENKEKLMNKINNHVKTQEPLNNTFIGSVVNRMLNPVIIQELQLRNLSTNGNAGIRKKRLKQYILNNCGNGEPIDDITMNDTLFESTPSTKPTQKPITPRISVKRKKNKGKEKKKLVSPVSKTNDAQCSDPLADYHESKVTNDSTDNLHTDNVPNSTNDNVPKTPEQSGMSGVNSKANKTTTTTSDNSSRPLKILESSVLQLRSDLERQSNCFDLLLKEGASKKENKPKHTKLLEDKINEVGKQVEESNNNLLKLVDSISHHTYCIDKLTDKLEFISTNNAENTKRLIDEMCIMRKQISECAQNQHVLSLKQVEAEKTYSLITSDIQSLKHEHVKLIEEQNAKYCAEINYLKEEISALRDNFYSKKGYIADDCISNSDTKTCNTPAISSNKNSKNSSANITGPESIKLSTDVSVPCSSTKVLKTTKTVKSLNDNSFKLREQSDQCSNLIKENSNLTNKNLKSILTNPTRTNGQNYKNEKCKKIESDVHVPMTASTLASKSDKKTAVPFNEKKDSTSKIRSNNGKRPATAKLNSLNVNTMQNEAPSDQESSWTVQGSRRTMHKITDRPNHRYKKWFSLVLHDGTHNNFDEKQFNSNLRVRCHKTNGLVSLSREKELDKLTTLIKRLNPDCVYVHLGINDIIAGKSIDELLSYYHDLAVMLLNKCRGNVCFSLPIPTKNNESLNNKVRQLNWDLKDLVYYLRSKPTLGKDRMFTLDNSIISDHSTFRKNIDSHPVFNQRGRKMIWMRLEEGLKKPLDYPVKALQTLTSINKKVYD